MGYYYAIYGNYGYGFEELSAYDKLKEALTDIAGEVE